MAQMKARDAELRVRLAALLTALCVLLGVAPLVVLAGDRVPISDDTIAISSGASFKFIATMTGENGGEQQATVYHNTTTDEYEIDAPVPMDGQFQAWFQMVGSGGRNKSNLFVKIVETNTGKTVTTTDQKGTVGEYWINESSQPDLHVNGDGTQGKAYTMDPSAWLSPGTDYYLFILKSSTCGNTTFGRDFVIHFRTDGESTVPEEAAVDSVSLSETGLLFDGIGQSYGLSATVLPKNAADQSVSWTSSAPSVATVDANGHVTAVAPGNATVTVTTNDGAKTAACPVTVRDADSLRTMVKVPQGAVLQTENGKNYRVDAPETYRDVSASGRLLVLPPFDLTTDPVFALAIYNVGGGTKGMSQHVNIYSDAALTNAVAKGGVGNENAPEYPQVGMRSETDNGKSDLNGTYTVDASVLNTGNTYYFVMEADSSTGGGGALGEPVIIEFTTSGEHEEPPQAPLTVTKLESSNGAALPEQTNTTLTATAVGGTAPYTYKFIVYNNDTGAWYKIRDFASENTCSWYTGAAGSKVLYV
ncbi:MAG: Ig domain-containing protein, partial [Clostridia bacterium]|nr:Ig domain-containing protein [Clostridia bacterium]